MPNYRADQYLTSLEKIYAQRDETDDPQAVAENTVQDLFFPISEKRVLIDTATVSYFDPSTFVWGNGSTIVAGWDWNGGGRWS